ncbi:MAG: hypothetical protein L6Q57_02085 [Alphaproteobacteria bacterium]|nr:hypothetical protein [Alphaproteobacteria bacterium]
MSATPPNDANVKVIKANKILQAKVGVGPLDEDAVRRSQGVIDSNDVDFAPLANEYLTRLGQAIEQAQKGTITLDQAVHAMTEPVMQLKANASTFRYKLISNLANIMLSFLEGLKVMDEDAVSIVAAHHKTLSAIVAKRMQGDGGLYGSQLEDELKSVCKRYFGKRAS